MTHKDDEGSKYLRAHREQVYASVMWLSWFMDKGDSQGMRIYSVELNSEVKTGSDYQMRIKALDESGAPFITWINASDLTGLFTALKGRYEQWGLKWREDLPYGVRQAKAEEAAKKAKEDGFKGG